MNLLLYVLNVVCASGQSALGKRCASKGGSSAVFNINKALSGLIIFSVFSIIFGLSFHAPSLLAGFLYGVFLCISMHTGFKALGMGPMALTSIIASFSLVIPLIFGISVWGEKLSVYGIIGMVMLSAAIVLLNFKKESGVSVKWSVYALLTLLANGICSIVQKYHQIYFPAQYRTEFMISALATVLLILTATHAADRNRTKFNFGAEGIVAGAMNGAANYIVLYLSATEKAAVLFPIVSVANVIAVWIIGKYAFKERLKKNQLLGLVLGALSIVLLKL